MSVSTSLNPQLLRLPKKENSSLSVYFDRIDFYCEANSIVSDRDKFAL